MGEGTAVSPGIDNSSDLLVSDSLEVGNDVRVGGSLTVRGSSLKTEGDLYVGTDNIADNDYIFMDGSEEALFWSESETRFRFSDDLYVSGGLETEGDVNAGGNIQTGGQFQYEAPQTFYLQLPGVDFRPMLCYPLYIQYHGTALVLLNSEDAFYYASVKLPQGAVISQVRFYFYDNDSDNFLLTGQLLRRHIGSVEASPNWLDENEIMAEASYTTSSESLSILSVTDNSVADNVIDNQNYQYVLQVRLASDGNGGLNQRFYGTRIEYTLQTLKP